MARWSPSIILAKDEVKLRSRRYRASRFPPWGSKRARHSGENQHCRHPLSDPDSTRSYATAMPEATVREASRAATWTLPCHERDRRHPSTGSPQAWRNESSASFISWAVL